jgi:DNA primase
MALYTKESLEALRQRVDLVDVLSAHIDLKRVGSGYKALCPFHEEKTPSFIVQKGDTHYHCFGCGAHGDAIAFLMGHLRLSFRDAIESLAERFQVTLEVDEHSQESKGPNKTALRAALEEACKFYHFLLLHSEEGKEPLKYLYERGLDLNFIRTFEVGFAPKQPGLFQEVMREKGIADLTLEQAGLILATSSGRKRDFFFDRITFPIRDAVGHVIGFSARKFKEETHGGKYINTSETALFKKSNVLFGLSYSRQRIAKERRAIVVEGQIDALRLIDAGFNLAVAGQGTAFGDGHVKQLCDLGVEHVYLALDGDTAGQEAAVKIGDLFQKKGVEVSIVPLPPKGDPDTVLRESGPPGFLTLLKSSTDYLNFLFRHFSKGIDLSSPSAKNSCVQRMTEMIRRWEQPVMVHESLRKVAKIAAVPESTLGSFEMAPLGSVTIKKSAWAGKTPINPDRVLEADLLRWIFLQGATNPRLIEIAHANLETHHWKEDACRRFFSFYVEAHETKKPLDLFALAIQLDSPEDQQLLSELMQKKVNPQRAEESLIATVQKILERDWMERRQQIQERLHSGQCTDDEALTLAKEFDSLAKSPPEVVRPA